MKAWKILGIITLSLVLLIMWHTIWYGWELVREGFPLENIVKGELPQREKYDYSIGQGSAFNLIWVGIDLGTPVILLFGILTIISWFQARRRRNRL